MPGLRSIHPQLAIGGLALAAAAAACARTAAPGEICILSLSGPDVALGRAARMALEDHIQAVNAKGGILGRKVRLIIDDDRSSYEQALACGARLMSQDHVAGIIGNGYAHSAVHLAPLCASPRVPFIGPGARGQGIP